MFLLTIVGFKIFSSLSHFKDVVSTCGWKQPHWTWQVQTAITESPASQSCSGDLLETLRQPLPSLWASGFL